MRQWKVLLLLFLVLTVSPQRGQAQTVPDAGPVQESIQAQLEALDLGQLLKFAEVLEEEYRQFLPSLDIRDLLGGGEGMSSPGELLVLILRKFLRELYLSLHLLRQLVVIGILAALLEYLSRSFGSKAVVDLASAVSFLVLVILGLQSFQIASNVAASAIDQMVGFMYSLIPMLSTLLAAVGAVTSAAVFHPMLWAVVGTIASLVQNLLLPMILVSTAFSLVAYFSTDLQFPKLGRMLRQGVISLLGLSFIVFSGFMAVRGAIAPVTDGISLRTAKYLTKTLVPIAGGMFADTLEVVVGGSLLIKNAVGVFGLVMILFMVAAPLLKVWAMILVYKVVGAFLEPVCNRRIVQVLGTMEASLTLVLIALATVALMLFLSITILVGIGNLAVLMR
ncbi:MAG: stage III sporulation protein AE [Bacillota bacterium]|nr:stage III sporulation protein AE [Bacillota bacterium]NLJ03491.1 stage III sporulation protein AE [Bacillota bacterium]